MTPDLVPALDPTPVPGPPWLFHFLLVLTFFLHALFMNVTLGGTILAAVGQLQSRGRIGDHRSVLAARLMTINTFGISLTITTGVAPLLFVQTLYQQYFYTATILIGWIWLLFLVMLMVGYYAVYLYKFRGTPSGRPGGTVWLGLAAAMFLLISMVHVAVNLIHAQPGKWSALADDPWLVLGDPAYWPRLLHFVLASIGFSGLVIAWWAVRRARAGEDVELNGKIARFGWRWALWTTVAQVIDGFLLLLVLPQEVLSSLMKGGAATLVPLGLSIVLGLGMLMMLSRVSDPTEKPGLVGGTLVSMTSTIAIMSITRHQVRVAYLEPVTARYEAAITAQWGNVAIFAVCLVAAVAIVTYMVTRVLAERTTGTDAA
jgi:hypothetical protein